MFLKRAPPPHSGRKLRFLAPLDIPDISGYQLGMGSQFVKAYYKENKIIRKLEGAAFWRSETIL